MKKRFEFLRGASFVGRITPNHLPSFLVQKLSIVPAALLCLSLVSAAATDSNGLPFQIGDRVQAVSQTPIFLTPPYSGRFAGNQPPGAQGSIIEGPVRAGEVWWWKVHFESGSEGWAAERQIL